jgi:hypothetical protein
LIAADRGEALALVESPAQLLHALEYWWDAYGAGAPARFKIAILAPDRGPDARQLAALFRMAETEGVAARWFGARRSRTRWVHAAASLARRTARPLVVGDPFSGLIQAIMAIRRPHGVVVVDDGAATLEFVRRLAAAKPLTRPADQRDGLGARLGGRLARHTVATLRSLDHLEVFTTMPVDRLAAAASLGHAHFTTHSYAWLKHRFPHPPAWPGTDIVGSSLAATGVLDGAAYLEAISAQAARGDGPVRYWAHRRESEEGLAQVARRAGALIIRSDWPLELALRRRGVGDRVVALPTSAVFTLPRALADLSVSFEVIAPEPDWFAPTASARSVAQLRRLTALARGATAE